MTSVCIEVASRVMSVQHVTPEQEAERAHDVWLGKGRTDSRSGQAEMRPQ